LPRSHPGYGRSFREISRFRRGFHNNNGQTADGREFGPCTIQGNEVCNGQNDNCNGATDEGLTPGSRAPA
jgi:hypothetical protein